MMVVSVDEGKVDATSAAKKRMEAVWRSGFRSWRSLEEQKGTHMEKLNTVASIPQREKEAREVSSTRRKRKVGISGSHDLPRKK